MVGGFAAFIKYTYSEFRRTVTCHRNVYFEFLSPNVILIDFFGAEVAAQLTKLTNFTTPNVMYVYTGR